MQEMDHGFKELVDRILNGELGFEMTKNADRYSTLAQSYPHDLTFSAFVSNFFLIDKAIWAVW